MTQPHNQISVSQTPNSVSIKAASLTDKDLMSDEETKLILTPFAFKIDESLFGIPLALPWRRGLALFFDFILIAILSSAPGELLAIVVAITFYKLGNSKSGNKLGRLKQLRRIIFRILGAFIIFVVLIDTLPELFKGTVSEKTNTKPIVTDDGTLDWAKGIALGALSTKTYQQINVSECQDTACWQIELLPFVEQLPALSKDEETVKGLVDAMVATIDEKNKLSKSSQKELEQYFFNQYLQLKSSGIEEDSLEKAEAESERIGAQLSLNESTKSISNEHSFGYKGIEWFKGIIDDLGLGFGWAAFYFTVLTSIWHGQTPGKKLFNIRVVQLDGTKLSLWDSFGRYGGYGAGLATGLLGFFQIYWDPNRQAIHDKISATVVIDVKLYKKMKAESDEKSSA
jgi:hypothetical protein